MLHNKKRVCIIGAGAAGMTCGHLLKNMNYNLIILEASNTFGGRIKSLKGFSQGNIELGGEEIHGSNTIYYKYACQAGVDVIPFWKQNIFYSEYKGEFIDIDTLSSKHKEFKYIWDLFKEISYDNIENYPDISFKEYLRNKNINSDIDFLANAMFGIEMGTDLDKLSIGGFSKMCRTTKRGDDNFMLYNMTHSEILEKTFSNILKDIQYNVQIKKIDYKGESVILKDQNEKEYHCDYCIITVPVSQIKKLSFEPKLSVERVDAFNRLEMDNVAKLILKFKKAFWPENSAWIIIPGLINVFWPVTKKNSNDFVLTGMISGSNARELNHLYNDNKDKFIKKVICEMEKSFKCSIMPLLMDFYWFDWKNEPFIEGGYSYLIVDEGNTRDIISEPIENKLFFAGEAYSKTGDLGTIHGAIETAYEATRKLKI